MSFSAPSLDASAESFRSLFSPASAAALHASSFQAPSRWRYFDDLDLRVDPGDDHSPKRAARGARGGQNADPNRARRPRAAPSFDDDATKRLWKLAVRR